MTSHRRAACLLWLLALGCHRAAAPTGPPPSDTTPPEPPPAPAASAGPPALSSEPPAPSASGKPSVVPPLPALAKGAIWGEFTWATDLASAERTLQSANFDVRVRPIFFEGQPEERSARLGPWEVLLRSYAREPFVLTEIQIHGTDLDEQTALATEARMNARHGSPQKRYSLRVYEWEPETKPTAVRAVLSGTIVYAKGDAPREPSYELNITIKAQSPGATGYASLRWRMSPKEVEEQLRASGASRVSKKLSPVIPCDSPRRDCGLETLLQFKLDARTILAVVDPKFGLNRLTLRDEAITEAKSQKRIQEIDAIFGQAKSVEEMYTLLWGSPDAKVSFSRTLFQPKNTLSTLEQYTIPKYRPSPP